MPVIFLLSYVADDFPEDFKKRLASDPEFYDKFRHAVEHDLNVCPFFDLQSCRELTLNSRWRK